MKSLIFPGQGSQAVGMGIEFYKNFKLVKNIFQMADDTLKFKISDVILDGPNDKLQLTENTQPGILTVSYSIFKILTEEFGFKLDNFKNFAGHSLGEYSALVCAESLKFEDAVYLVRERGKAMQNAVPVGKGAMLAVLGESIEIVNDYLKQVDIGVCEVANDNAPGQIIVSGDIKAIEKLKINLKNNKKKCIPLPVSAPFHCSLMNKAALDLKKKIDEINFKTPKFEIISNVTASPQTNPSEIKKLLYQQIYSKVRWRESINIMINNKTEEFIEIGPGKVLTGLCKRINKEIKVFSINSIDDIKNSLK